MLRNVLGSRACGDHLGLIDLIQTGQGTTYTGKKGDAVNCSATGTHVSGGFDDMENANGFGSPLCIIRGIVSVVVHARGGQKTYVIRSVTHQAESSIVSRIGKAISARQNSIDARTREQLNCIRVDVLVGSESG